MQLCFFMTFLPNQCTQNNQSLYTSTIFSWPFTHICGNGTYTGDSTFFWPPCIAISDTDGNFYLNGDLNINQPGRYRVASTVFRYQRRNIWKMGQWREEPEVLTSQGPIDRVIIIMVRFWVWIKENIWLSHRQPGYNFWMSVQVFTCP